MLSLAVIGFQAMIAASLVVVRILGAAYKKPDWLFWARIRLDLLHLCLCVHVPTHPIATRGDLGRHRMDQAERRR